MQQSYSLKKPLYTKIAEGIFVGNKYSSKDVDFLSKNNITAIINVSGKSKKSSDIDYFNYVLPGQELMESEIPKTINKLKIIVQDIVDLKLANQNILIYCLRGQNKCMLVAGYYLINRCDRPPENVIEQLEQTYLSEEQKIADREYLKITKNLENGKESTLLSPEQLTLAQVRNESKCLLLQSFKKILQSGKNNNV